MSTMKAVVLHEFGGVEQLRYEDVPIPKVTDGEVLVKIYAVGINPVEYKFRQGSNLRLSLPYILGWDIAGEVIETQSEQFQIGDRVFGMSEFPQEAGGYAQFATAPADHLTHIPANLDYVQAAAVPLAALTAHQAFELVNLRVGQRVLIHAAAGGVGHFAVQLAKLRGAYVIGTASAPNHEFLRNLGANELVDYRAVAFEDMLMDIDVVMQTIGGIHAQKSIKTIRDNGILVKLVGSTEVETERNIQIPWMLVEPNQIHMQKLAQWLANGELIPTVSHIFSLAEVQRAHQQLESGHTRGKIVLQIN